DKHDHDTVSDEFTGKWTRYRHNDDDDEAITARTGHSGACIHNGQYLVLFGGERSNGSFSNEITLFNGIEWVNVSHNSGTLVPTSRKYASIASVPIMDQYGNQIDDSIVLFGGLRKPSGVDNEFWQFTFSTQTWSLLSNGSSSSSSSRNQVYPDA